MSGGGEGRGFGRELVAGVALNGAFVAIEAGYGLRAGSIALVTDALHNLGDVLGLGLAAAAVWLSRVPPTRSHTYGFRRASILAALSNSGLQLVGVGGLAWAAIERLSRPAPVAGTTVMAVAAAGIVVNGGTAALLARGRRGELNIRAAYAHMAADALIAAGVVAVGLTIRLTGLTALDPLAGLGIAFAIARSAWSTLRESADLALDAVPRGVDSEAIAKLLEEVPGVASVTDLHIWAMSTSETAMTAHLVCPSGLSDEALRLARAELETRFGVAHSTLQVDRDPDRPCSLASD